MQPRCSDFNKLPGRQALGPRFQGAHFVDCAFARSLLKYHVARTGISTDFSMDYLEKARRVIALEITELERLRVRIDDSFARAIECLLACLENKGKIVVCGVGKSGHIGEKIAATLTSTGSPAVVLNSLNALHGDLGVVGDGDVVLALSYSGETDELANILPALARFDAKIIAMTGDAGSF